MFLMAVILHTPRNPITLLQGMARVSIAIKTATTTSKTFVRQQEMLRRVNHVNPLTI